MTALGSACATDSSSPHFPRFFCTGWEEERGFAARGVAGRWPRPSGGRRRRRPRIPYRPYPGWRWIWIRGFIPLVLLPQTKRAVSARPGPSPPPPTPPLEDVVPSALGMSWGFGRSKPRWPQGCPRRQRVRSPGCLTTHVPSRVVCVCVHTDLCFPAHRPLASCSTPACSPSGPCAR